MDEATQIQMNFIDLKMCLESLILTSWKNKFTFDENKCKHKTVKCKEQIKTIKSGSNQGQKWFTLTRFLQRDFYFVG